MTYRASDTRIDLDEVAAAVWARCVDDGFRGIDPYDGLKSRLLGPLLSQSEWLRLAVLQGVKRCPVNLRPLLRIPAGMNPKCLALLLLATSNQPRLAAPEARRHLADLLIALASHPDGSAVYPGRQARAEIGSDFAQVPPAAVGWGYDFPWQARTTYMPPFYPTVVCTSFVVDALAAAEHPAAGAAIRGAAEFVRRHLNRHTDTTGSCYSYSPNDRTRVFNASLFAGKILARAALAAESSEAGHLRDEAIRTVDYVVARQRADGAWVYGEAGHWKWIDNLHTGYVLGTIADIGRLIGDRKRWEAPLARGLAYYCTHFFGADLTPWYFADRPGLLDSHTVGQSALTLLAFHEVDPALPGQARRVLEIGVERLFDPRRRGFMYQRGRVLKRGTIYMRWSQAWMLRAMTACLAREAL